ncbi:MAG: hypothetical protein J6Y32_06150 [Bacteroidales bacterium]|nr:hypothetical protein [Bacteroidales bacterium]
MKQLLVIFHLYYRDQLPWFLEKLGHIHGCSWDLVVTGPSFHEEDKAALLSLNPEARFIPCENVGYDVWPFLFALQGLDLTAYEWVLKLHTKSNTGSHKIRLNGVHLRGFDWRDTLVDALLESDARWEEVLAAMKDASNGLICSRKLYCKLEFAEDHRLLDEELKRLGLDTQERRFCVGTMFLIRSEALQKLPLSAYRAAMFPRQSKSNSGGTPAHIYERVFSLLPPALGYKVCTLGSDKAFERRMRLRRYTKPFLEWLFSIDRKGEDEQKYLTLLGIRFRL